MVQHSNSKQRLASTDDSLGISRREGRDRRFHDGAANATGRDQGHARSRQSPDQGHFLVGRCEAKSHCNACKWFTATLNVYVCTLAVCLLPHAEFETVFMIAVGDRRDAWGGLSSRPEY